MTSVRSLCGALVFGVASALMQVQSATAQTYNWTGLYFGGHVGAAWSTADARDVRNPNGGYFTTAKGDTFSFENDGFAGGGQLGYQRQFGNWVLGGEVSATWADTGDRQVSPFFPASDTVDMRIGPILAATARLGYAWDRWLVYVKGGYARAEMEFSAYDAVNDVGLMKGNHWDDGYTVGGGLEFAISNGVRLGVDYSYIDLDAGWLFTRNTLGTTERFQTPGEIHTVSARLNFQIGQPERLLAPPAYEPLK